MEKATVRGTWPSTSIWPQAPTTTTSSGRVPGSRWPWPWWISIQTSESKWTCTEWSPLTLIRCPVREGEDIYLLSWVSPTENDGSTFTLRFWVLLGWPKESGLQGDAVWWQLLLSRPRKRDLILHHTQQAEEQTVHQRRWCLLLLESGWYGSHSDRTRTSHTLILFSCVSIQGPHPSESVDYMAH